MTKQEALKVIANYLHEQGCVVEAPGPQQVCHRVYLPSSGREPVLIDACMKGTDGRRNRQGSPAIEVVANGCNRTVSYRVTSKGWQEKVLARIKLDPRTGK